MDGVTQRPGPSWTGRNHRRLDTQCRPFHYHHGSRTRNLYLCGCRNSGSDHLRFFTKQSIVDLFQEAGLDVTSIVALGTGPSGSRLERLLALAGERTIHLQRLNPPRRALACARVALR